jgi:hypothetical protein
MAKKDLTITSDNNSLNMKIQDKISEVKGYLEELRKTAKKHLENKDMRKYKTVCNLILDNEKVVAEYKKSSICSSRVILKRIRSNAKAH